MSSIIFSWVMLCYQSNSEEQYHLKPKFLTWRKLELLQREQEQREQLKGQRLSTRDAVS